jgi:hypothetical protein
MAATREIYPEITILNLYGHTVVWNEDRDPENTKAIKPMEAAQYGLYVPFLDGMMEGASDGARFVDGYEFAYAFKDRQNFEQGYQTIKRRATVLSDAPKCYAKVQAGFGLWLDNGGEQQWSTTDFKRNHFSPSEFESALRSALEISDGYVWIYSHAPRFFPREKFPEEYLKAISQAQSAR